MTLRTGRAGGGENKTLTLDLISFDSAALDSGRRFLARPTESSTRPESATGDLRGRLNNISRAGDGLLFKTSGGLNGEFYLRPVRLHGSECYLFGRRSERMAAGGAR